MRRLFATLLLILSGAAHAETPRVAIIIDDLGYHLANGKRASHPHTCSKAEYSTKFTIVLPYYENHQSSLP